MATVGCNENLQMRSVSTILNFFLKVEILLNGIELMLHTATMKAISRKLMRNPGKGQGKKVAQNIEAKVKFLK